MIYGDIVAEAWRWDDSDVSSYSLSRQLAELDVDAITVGINSYGGDISEGLAIYNALKRHRAKVTTRCDGFACSIASVVFMAGDERVMADPSMLMIHNGWTCATGNAKELRKAADDIEKMTEASVGIYLHSVGIEEDELRRLMDEETWIGADDAVEMGFATAIEESKASDKPSQSVREKVMQMLRNPYRQLEDEEEPDTDEVTEDDPETADGTAEDAPAPEDTEEPTEPEADTEGDADPDATNPDENPEDEDEPTTQERFAQFLTAISR